MNNTANVSVGCRGIIHSMYDMKASGRNSTKKRPLPLKGKSKQKKQTEGESRISLKSIASFDLSK